MQSLVVAIALVCTADAARILAFVPLQVKSHHYVYRPILEALAKRGHEVVYFTGYPYEEGKIPRGIEQLDISPHMPDMHSQVKVLDLVDLPIFNALLKQTTFVSVLGHNILSTPTFHSLIHSDRGFDAVLMSSYVIQEYASGLIHKFGAVGIEVMPLGDYSWTNELSGLPDNPAFQVDFHAELTPNMDLWQRLHNTYITFLCVAFGYYNMISTQAVMDQYFNYTGSESRPPIGQLLSNRSLILINAHFAVGYPMPRTPHRVDIGGINVKPSKPLPKAIQTFMDESMNGVIYFSLGTNVNVSDPQNQKIVAMFMKVFRELPQRVLMKWETDYSGVLPKNVELGRWFPQQDVLAHNKCVLFITHGGYLSLSEAVFFGVPLIGIPYFGDQPKNMLFVEDAGIGKMIRIRDVDDKLVSETVKEVLYNKSYKENMMKRSRMFRDRRHSAVEDAVYWIEHSIKYPNVLTPKSATLSFVQLHLLDVWAFLLLLSSVSVFVLWNLCVAALGLLPSASVKVKKS